MFTHPNKCNHLSPTPPPSFFFSPQSKLKTVFCCTTHSSTLFKFSISIFTWIPLFIKATDLHVGYELYPRLSWLQSSLYQSSWGLMPWWLVGQELPHGHKSFSSQDVSPKSKDKFDFTIDGKNAITTILDNETPLLRKVAKCSLGLVYDLVASLKIILQSSASGGVGQRPTRVPLHLEVDT